MRPLDHWDIGEEDQPVLNCCDRCTERETTEDSFFHCDDCGEILCPEHFAEGDWGANRGTCGGCVARRNEAACEAEAGRQANR